MKHIITRTEAINRNLKTYFTGKPCKYGHVVERLTLTSKCVTCHQESNDHFTRLAQERRKAKAKVTS